MTVTNATYCYQCRNTGTQHDCIGRPTKTLCDCAVGIFAECSIADDDWFAEWSDEEIAAYCAEVAGYRAARQEG